MVGRVGRLGDTRQRGESNVVGIALMLEGQEDLTWERFFRFAEAAETLGLEGLFRSDHLTALGGNAGRESLALWPSMTALALRTTKIRFGPLVCSITFRHPAMVAKMAASVDVLSGGRLDLGIGAGWFAREHDMFGIPYPKYSKRLDRLDEGAQLIRDLWSGEPVTTSGEHYSLTEAETHPEPVQSEPPLIMGGKGERTLQIVARHATEWNCSYSTVAVFEEKSAVLDRACEALGRNPGTLRRSMMLPFAIGRDDIAVQTHISAHRETFPFLPSDPAEWLSSGFLVGSPQEIVDQIGERADVGVSRFYLQQNALDDLDSVELLATDVLARLT